jgi:hypothetical protein
MKFPMLKCSLPWGKIPSSTEGLQTIQAKPRNYSQFAHIKQEMEEVPSAFPERLREVLTKHTNLNSDIYEGQLILKDKFITQSAPDV